MLMSSIATPRTIVHFDLDAFFVSVECGINDHFKLKGLPLLVGGHSDRGVVAACSYEARKYGIHSAMPMKTAMRLCPHAIVRNNARGEYSKYSRMVTEIIAAKAPLVEKASIDEFYLDLTGMNRFFDPYQWTIDLAGKRIIAKATLPISLPPWLPIRWCPRSPRTRPNPMAISTCPTAGRRISSPR